MDDICDTAPVTSRPFLRIPRTPIRAGLPLLPSSPGGVRHGNAARRISRDMARTSSFRNFTLQLALLLILNSALAPSTSAKEKPGQFRASCRIEVDNAHLSKSIKRRESVDAVKVNARSICDAYQTNVVLTVQIYQEGLFRDYLRSSYTTNPTRATSNGFRVENKNTKWYCQTRKPSKFYGIAFSTATIGGQQFIAPRARSVISVSLPCGI